MKKLFVLFLIVALAVSALVLVACDKHEYGDWIEEVPANCTEAGTVGHYHCSHCGKDFDRDYNEISDLTIDALGHDWQEQYVIPATCTADGSHVVKCSRCEETDTQTISMTEHTWSDWSVLEAPTAESGGKEIRTCEVCRHSEFRDIDSKGHDWGEWSYDVDGYHVRQCNDDDCDAQQRETCIYDNGTAFEATCTDGAYVLYTCELCSHQNESEHGNPLGHQYGDWVQTIVEDESKGHTHTHYRDCTRCGESSARQTGDCQLVGLENIDATCTSPAYTSTKCETCGAEHDEITSPATGHNLIYEKYGGLIQQHRQKCTKCDYVTEYVNCTITDDVEQATCTSPMHHHYNCSLCNYSFNPTEGYALGHSWQAPEFSGTGDEGQHQHTSVCARCGENKVEDCIIVETKEAPTCTTDGSITKVCKYCLHSEESAGDKSLGHQWANNGAYTYAYDNHHQRVCSVCQYKDIRECSNETEDFPATCTEKEKVVTRCTVCKKETSETKGEVYGHNWEVKYIDATTHKIQCSKCQQIEEKKHDWSKSNLCAQCKYDGLDYKILGINCSVTGDSRVPNAKAIVIPATHKELNGQGGYETTEYTVNEIGSNAFTYHKNMESVSIPSSVAIIGSSAFSTCQKLVTVTIDGDGLTTIKEMAFIGCQSLSEFTYWPKSLTYIEQYAFENCTSLTNIDLGEEVVDIGFKAFSNTGYVNDSKHWDNEDVLYIGNHLIKVHNEQNADGNYINATVEVRAGTLSIAAYAFSDCSGTTSITMPNSLKVVDKNAFLNCDNITSVTFHGTFAEWMAISFENDYASPLHNSNVIFSITDATDSITIPDGVTRIPAGTFRGTTITSVVIPASVTFIGEEAFENCLQLASVTFEGDKVSHIGKDAFTNSAYYNSLDHWDDGKVLYIGKYLIDAKDDLDGQYSVKSGTLLIADKAFVKCGKLTGVVINSELKYIGEGAFPLDGTMNFLQFADRSHRWFAGGAIFRSLAVTDDNLWKSYKYPHYGEWRRADA